MWAAELWRGIQFWCLFVIGSCCRGLINLFSGCFPELLFYPQLPQLYQTSVNWTESINPLRTKLFKFIIIQCLNEPLVHFLLWLLWAHFLVSILSIWWFPPLKMQQKPIHIDILATKKLIHMSKEQVHSIPSDDQEMEEFFGQATLLDSTAPDMSHDCNVGLRTNFINVGILHCSDLSINHILNLTPKYRGSTNMF